MVEQGRFRRDLFYRIGVARIALPPLRERKDEIPALAVAVPRAVRARVRPHAAFASATTSSRRCCCTTGRATSASSRTRFGASSAIAADGDTLTAPTWRRRS